MLLVAAERPTSNLLTSSSASLDTKFWPGGCYLVAYALLSFLDPGLGSACEILFLWAPKASFRRRGRCPHPRLSADPLKPVITDVFNVIFHTARAIARARVKCSAGALWVARGPASAQRRMDCCFQCLFSHGAGETRARISFHSSPTHNRRR